MRENSHKSQCKICISLFREDIEKDYVNWLTHSAISKKYPDLGLLSCNITRHVDYYPELRERRSLNGKAVLNRMIEMGTNGLDVNNDIDKEVLLKTIKINAEIQGQTSNANKQAPIQLGVIVQTQGAANLAVGATRFAFGLQPLQVGNNVLTPALQVPCATPDAQQASYEIIEDIGQNAQQDAQGQQYVIKTVEGGEGEPPPMSDANRDCNISPSISAEVKTPETIEIDGILYRRVVEKPILRGFQRRRMQRAGKKMRYRSLMRRGLSKKTLEERPEVEEKPVLDSLGQPVVPLVRNKWAKYRVRGRMVTRGQE